MNAPSSSDQESLYPSKKKSYQNAQLMNFLLRPWIGIPVRLLAKAGMSGDLLSLLGIAAYFGGAICFLQGEPWFLQWGAGAFAFGLFAELLDGGLARLRGPSAIGHGLSKWLEQLFLMLMTPSLSLGLYAKGAIPLGLAAAGVFAGLAHVAFRASVEAITAAHSAQSLATYADATTDSHKLMAIAQFLPDHPAFSGWMKGLRILRENLMESSGVLPLLMVLSIGFGHPEILVWYQALIQIPAYLLFSVLRLVLLQQGQGRLLEAPSKVLDQDSK